VTTYKAVRVKAAWNSDPKTSLHEAVLMRSGLGLASAEAFGELLEKRQRHGVE
jgi:hypothetical protein